MGTGFNRRVVCADTVSFPFVLSAPHREKHFGRYGFFNQRNATGPECKLYERIDASFVHTNSSVALAELI